MSSHQDHSVALADEKLLATLGYKQEFQRAFTPLEACVFGIAFSIIGLLPSIASVLFYSLPNGGPASMVWGWAVASLFILCVGLSMAELASAAPTSGGLYFWTHSLSAPRYRNLLAWIVGYANTIGSISAVASIDWGCAVQVMAAANIGTGYEPTSATTFAVYAGIIITHAFICCLGTKLLARLQSLYVVLNVLLCLAVIVALPVATPTELKNSAGFVFGSFTNAYDWPDGFAFFLSFLAPLWTICSFDSSVHISEEASNAATAVPWAIVLAIAISGVLGWAINVSLAFCMGRDLEALISSSQPMAQIFNQSFGSQGTLAVWAFVVLVQYMMGSSMMLAASRQSFAFSRDGALPFSKYLYVMNSYTKTPVNTVWFTAICSLLLGLLVFAGSQAINAVFALSITGLYVAYSIPIAARWIWANENGWADGPFSLGWFSLPCAILSVLGMAFFGLIFLFPAAQTTNVGNMNYTVVVLGGILILSLAWYYLPAYGGVHWFTGPVPNIEGFKSHTWEGESSSVVVDNVEKAKSQNYGVSEKEV
ncbi:APC amino acid permease [Vararia minispora EC-137]|uniref:APC amino acid permease n=1 Tax=Vararia minispora EC-137 TaxID=1314806 RepID=A0ACB8Q7K2_9AGAM|nr:APC amino acid permease [Vararia minispora EC-137]